MFYHLQVKQRLVFGPGQQVLCRCILGKEFRMKTTYLHSAVVRVFCFRPFNKAIPVIFLLVPPKQVKLVNIIITVIVLEPGSVPQLIAIPYSAVIPVSEIRTMTEEGSAATIVLVNITGPLVTGYLLPFLIKIFIPFKVLLIHSLLRR